jgi:hypothetical protein
MDTFKTEFLILFQVEANEEQPLQELHDYPQAFSELHELALGYQLAH